MSGAARPPATIQVARRVLRHEIHVTRKFHTSAVWPGVECGRSKMATSEMSVYWWREGSVDYAEAQFTAAISKEQPILSLGVSVEEGREGRGLAVESRLSG